MIMMRENDRHLYANNTPWFKKTRPGIRTANEHQSLPLAASLAFVAPTSREGLTVAINRPGEIGRHRIDGGFEALADGDWFTARNAAVIMVCAMLAFATYWAVAAFVVATEQSGDAITRAARVQEEGKLPGAALPAAIEQNLDANNQDSGAR